MPDSDQLIRTKLHFPATRANLVSRPRLQERILRGLHGPLTLITAPAGFGKTTLVASCMAGSRMRVAWLSLDKNDNHVDRFLRYLVASLQQADSSIARAAEQLLAEAQPAPPAAVLTSLINHIEDAAFAGIALILDDYHSIHTQAAHEAVAFLLEHCPDRLHVVILTRADPPLPLARLRACNQLTEIRAHDLRFTPPETFQFLNHVMGLSLTAEDVSVLETRTEGWIVGLQMAALALQGREDRSGFIRAFSGGHQYILEYLSEQVLSRQPEDIQSFLLRTSILDRLCGPLCDAIMGQSGGSQEKLERLDRANLFVVPLDEERQWYRYHHLFADLLRAQLKRSIEAQDLTRLHICASEWHESHGSIVEAIHHASMALDDQRVERLVEQNYMELVHRGEMTWVRAWTAELSKELIHKRPRLCIYEAYSHAWFGELDEADRLLDEAEKRIRSEVSEPDASAMQVQLAYVRSRVTAMCGDVRAAIELLREARERIPASNLPLQLDSITTLGYEYFLLGDYVHASKALNEAIEAGRAAGAVLTTVAAYCVLARLYAVHGLLAKSWGLYRKAEEWVREAGGEHLGATAVIEVGMAEVLCEWNDLDGALLHTQRGLKLMPMWGKADDAVLGHTTLARIHLAQSDRDAALEAVRNAAQLVQTRGVFPEARLAAQLAQVRLWLAQGDLHAASRWAASSPDGSDDTFKFESEAIHIARARVLIAQRRPDEAIALLSRLNEMARAAGRTGRVIEILLLKALALREMGDLERSVSALSECLELSQPEGYARLFLDEGKALQALLTHWLAQVDAGPVRDYGLHLHSEFEHAAHAKAATQEKARGAGSLVEPLSQRELEVLELIATGGTNQEIALKLVVSRGTIKAHTANIYRKLDVTNRTEAVARARQLGILA